MQIELAFEHVNREDIWLKYGYESYIQSLLYSLTEGDFGRFLHDQGYKYKERSYKLFAFSQILESPKAVKRDLKMFVFPSMITVRVSTVENEMMSALMQAIMNSQTVYRLGNNPVKLVSAKLLMVNAAPELEVEAKSPVCMYSTVSKPEGGNYTHYYSPTEPEFAQLIRENAIKKYAAYYGELPQNTNLEITPIGKMTYRSTLYKGTVINGYLGRFLLKGSVELIDMMLKAGMGDKNAQGKGLITPV